MNSNASTTPAAFDAERASAQQRAAAEPLQNYMQGHAADDASFMRRAFLPTARIESMQDGEFTSWPLETYCERFKGTPAADESSRRRTIDWLEVGGDAACAKVTLVHGATTFTDYFVLLDTAQGWKIANKAFSRAATT